MYYSCITRIGLFQLPLITAVVRPLIHCIHRCHFFYKYIYLTLIVLFIRLHQNQAYYCKYKSSDVPFSFAVYTTKTKYYTALWKYISCNNVTVLDELDFMKSHSTCSTISWNIKSYTDEVSGWNINLYIVPVFGKLVKPAVNYFFYLSLLIWATFSPVKTTWPILWQGCIVWVLRVSIKQSFPKTELNVRMFLTVYILILW